MFKYNELGILEIIDKEGLSKHLDFKYKSNYELSKIILENLFKNEIKNNQYNNGNIRYVKNKK